MQTIREFLQRNDIADLQDHRQLFSLIQTVAHIPWGEGRTIEEVLSTRHVGTCTGKHLVLQTCFEMLGIPHRTTVCTFYWSKQHLFLPDELRGILEEGEWEHGHNFLQIQNAGGTWIDVDITWDAPLKRHGFRTLPESWDGTSSFIGLDPLIERWDNADLSMKKQWIAALIPDLQERRERFMRGFFAWVNSLRDRREPR